MKSSSAAQLVPLLALMCLSGVACGDDPPASTCITAADCPGLGAACVDGVCMDGLAPDTGAPVDSALPVDSAAPDLDAGPPVETPVLRWPWNGAATGSPHAAGAAVAYPPLAPAFRWEGVPGASRYEIEVSDECETATYRSCAFASPTVAESLPGTVFRPGTDFEVALERPVGARFFFRVRACTEARCSPWSPVRYLDVGRSVQDFDGDGYADSLVGARRQNGVALREGAAWVLSGGPSGVTASAFELPAPDAEVDGYFAVDLAALGDANGDGYADAVIGAHVVDGVAVDSGRAYVYYGTAAGLPAVPDLVLNPPTDQTMAYFGRGVTGLGDVNGDGYADLAVSAYGFAGATTNEGAVYVYYGGARGYAADADVTLTATDPQESELFGVRVAAGGDVDGDGFNELLVSAYGWDRDVDTANSGRFFLFPGSAGGIGTTPARIVTSPNAEALGQLSYWVAGLGDVDGDSFGDVIVSARRENTRGRAYVFPGGVAGLGDVPSWTSEVPRDTSLEYGFVADAAGDVNGDGLADAVITARHDEGTAANRGRAWVFHGTTAGLTAAPARSLVGDPREAGAQFGFAAAATGDTDGDGRGDLFVGAVNQDQGQTNEGVGYWYLGTPAGIPAAADLKVDHPENAVSAQFGGSVARPIP